MRSALLLLYIVLLFLTVPIADQAGNLLALVWLCIWACAGRPWEFLDTSEER